MPDDRRNEPRREDDRVSLREYFEREIARHEAAVALEIAHVREDVKEAKSEFRAGLSDLRSDLTAITTSIAASTTALQSSIAAVSAKVHDGAVTWRVIFKVCAVMGTVILVAAAAI